MEDVRDQEQDSFEHSLLTTSLVPERFDTPSATTSVHFNHLLSPPILISQDLRNGCGGQTWPAGMVLSKYMLRNHSNDLSNKTVLELGSGGGLVGLAVARGCQISPPLYITDQLPLLHLMQDNIFKNNLDNHVRAVVLDWGTEIPSDIIPAHPDVILAADCVYFEPAFPLLIRTLDDLLGPESICYFCFKRRRRADWRFIKSAKKRFDMVEITDYLDYETNRKDCIFLYTIRRRRRQQHQQQQQRQQ
ncbi:Methyltransferase-like protein 21D [Ascosphaera aggregata]|nr:Methyltransferase-like protein 21D [Ascosphaera aggregata]